MNDTRIMSTQDAEVVARYRRRYGLQDRCLRMFDLALRFCLPFRARRAIDLPPRRILIANAGHLGDVILSTALLPALHDAFPGVEIGLLVGHYARSMIESHPLVARVHYLDHWRQSRTKQHVRSRVRSYLSSMRKVAGELRNARYDAAIDVRAWYPTFIPVLWLAGIPIRIGYSRMGWEPLLTHPVTYRYSRRHELEYQMDLLRLLQVPNGSLDLSRPNVAAPENIAVQEALAVVGPEARYHVLHPVSSTPTRDWPEDRWKELARRLLAAGVTPVVTGLGERDEVVARNICAAAPGAVNGVGRLSWDGLVALVDGAEAIYSVETSVGHLASALGRPIVAIYGGMADPLHWAPVHAAVATHELPCHPCINRAGCASRACITGITVDDVQSRLSALIRQRVGQAIHEATRVDATRSLPFA